MLGSLAVLLVLCGGHFTVVKKVIISGGDFCLALCLLHICNSGEGCTLMRYDGLLIAHEMMRSSKVFKASRVITHEVFPCIILALSNFRTASASS